MSQAHTKSVYFSSLSWGALLPIGVTVLAFACSALQNNPSDFPGNGGISGEYGIIVHRVIDGDTIELIDGTRVRLIGVDAPESVHPYLPPQPYGQEAASYLRNAVEGKAGSIRFDETTHDAYGRTLAYLYVDDVFVNQDLVSQGLATAEVQWPYSSLMKSLLLKSERDAREAGVGIWQK